MKLRYAGVCSRCGAAIEAGVVADYDRTSKTVSCVDCAVSPPLTAPAPSMPTPPANPLVPTDNRPSSPAGAAQSSAPRHAQLEVVDGVAGGSAQHEFQRRHDRRQERVQTAHPRIGKVLLAVFDDPQSTTAWSTGAVGEERLGDMLAGVAGQSLRVLHDRRIPRTTANIDHLVVCPTGVYVVDAKRYKGKRPELKVEGGRLRPRKEFLLVGGRDRTKLVEGMHKQTVLVREALADRPDIPVYGVLCFVEADWPLFGGSFSVNGVAVLWLKKLAAVLTQPGPLDADAIEHVQWTLHEAFPRQKEVH